MIGIKAVPARFGGFETAVDELSRGLVKLGYGSRVYNRAGMSSWHDSKYEGVEIVTLPTVKSKSLSTVVHAFLATIHVMFHPVDVVHYFTTGTTIWAPLPRLLGMKVVCSVDGTDWQRSKWHGFARFYLRLSERLAARWCHALVSDSEAVKDYYRQQYEAASTCITYGIREERSDATSWLECFGLRSREYVLFVGRLVPENNIHLLIRAFERVQTTKNLVIVGDDPWEREYIRTLKSTNDARIIFTGGVYGEGYAQLQQNAYLFVLPDEIGGTHPALVEAMGYSNCVLVNDTPSNLEVIGDAGFSYRGAMLERDLRFQLQRLLDDPDLVQQFRDKAFSRAARLFRWDMVVHNHARLYDELLHFSKSSDVRACTQAGFFPKPRNRISAALKRLVDVLGSCAGLVLTLPLSVAIALAVVLSSPGPIFYKWRVVGEGGRKFTSFKFRSMYLDADLRKEALLARNEMQGPVFKMKRDPRITPVGRFLRKYSLDELPQLWSVLKGDMSLVGPRPPLQSEYERFSDWQKLKLHVKPGITCLWQVGGRNQISDFDEWVKLDLKYIENWSLLLDFKILAQTLPAILLGKGR